MVSLVLEYVQDNICVNVVVMGGIEVLLCKILCNIVFMLEQEVIWYQGIVDQIIVSSLMYCYGMIDEQV